MDDAQRIARRGRHLRCNRAVKRLLESCKELARGRRLREECRKSIKGTESDAAGGLVEVIINAKGFWEICERA